MPLVSVKMRLYWRERGRCWVRLSKKESMYRQKIFYENGYKKDGQKELDSYVKKNKTTYKLMYITESVPEMLAIYLSTVAMKRLTKSLKMLDVNVKNVSENFKTWEETFKELSLEWNV